MTTTNMMILTDSKKLERIQNNSQPFSTVDMDYHYDNLSEKLNLLTLHMRSRHSDALLLINIFSGTIYCPSVLEAVGNRVPTRNVTLPYSVTSPATTLQLDAFLLLMEFVNLQIFLETRVEI
jgi:hypothetical protein